MTGRPRHEDTAALSMLRRLVEASPAGEVPLQEARGFAGALAPGHGWDLLNDLIARKLIITVGGGAIQLVRITDAGRTALDVGDFPEPAPVAPAAGQADEARLPAVAVPSGSSGRTQLPPAGAGAKKASDGADGLAASMRENAVFVATAGGIVIAVSGVVLTAIGVPEAQAAATQSRGSLDLWGNGWFVAGIAVGALGLLLLVAATILYVGKRRAAVPG